jgi:mannose-6-phosphate isomerase-like protein (cupin superfamily)
MSEAFKLDSTYIHLRPDESAISMEGGDKFWADIDERRDLNQGRFMGVVMQSTDWDHWERHPAGDEILVLLSGEMDLLLEQAGKVERTTMRTGQTFIVPKGVWHHGVVKKPGRLMFITPGAGTEVRHV